MDHVHRLSSLVVVFVAALVGAALVGGACGPHFAVPYTRADLHRDLPGRGGAALLHYLAQDGADGVVCGKPAVARHLDARALRQLVVKGLVDGVVASSRLEACAKAAYSSLSPGLARALGDAVVDGYEILIGRRPVPVSRLEVAQRLIVERPAQTQLDATRLVRTLRRVEVTGPARAMVATLLETLELESGQVDGQPVDMALIGRLQDERLLLAMTTRLPAPALRAAARRRVIDLRIAASRSPYVEEHASAVRRRVFTTGRNAVNLQDHRPTAARLLATRGGGVSTIVVKQSPAAGRSALFASRPGGGRDLVSTLMLRGKLRIHVAGFIESLTLCGSPQDLDIEPCIDAAELTLTPPFARLGDDGEVRLAEYIGTAALERLFRGGRTLELAITLRGDPLATVEFPIRFARPETLRFRGAPSSKGPDLLVIARRAHGRVAFEVLRHDRSEETRYVVIEEDELPAFGVISVGGDGHRGTPGRTGRVGSIGRPGTNAGCPYMHATDGGPGGAGETGGPGGDGRLGGDGGAIDLRVSCGAAACDDLIATLGDVVQSRAGSGGAAGPGGRGGRGGPGGSGGAGTRCRTGTVGGPAMPGPPTLQQLPGGNRGTTGMSGMNGPDGQAGQDGRRGSVRVSLIPEG